MPRLQLRQGELPEFTHPEKSVSVTSVVAGLSPLTICLWITPAARPAMLTWPSALT